jgi:hypothetical protein
MFATLLPIFIELFKYQSGKGLTNKIQMTQEQIQKSIQENVSIILVKFFGGLIFTVALCYSLIGLFNLVEVFINSLQYATEIKIAFFIMILIGSLLGLKKIFGAKNSMALQMPAHAPLKTQQEHSVVQGALNQFMQGLNEGLANNRNKKSAES